MREIELDLRAADDPRELHNLVCAALALKDAYGGNLDALYDALTSVCGETALTVRYRPEKPQPFLNYQNKALRVLRDACCENENLRLILRPEG